MENNEIRSNIIRMISDLFPDSGIDADVIEYVDLIDDLGMDSVSFISIVIEVESLFNIIVPDDMLLLECFRTVDKICEVVKNALTQSDCVENISEDSI
jgi:acyl carrier protein